MNLTLDCTINNASSCFTNGVPMKMFTWDRFSTDTFKNYVNEFVLFVNKNGI